MKKLFGSLMAQKIVLLSLVSFVLAAGIYGCGHEFNQTAQYQADINNMITAKWQSYMAARFGFGGGVALYIISPKGSFYASANMPDGTEDTHFRGASTTKSFTASSIMLLHQQGKLNIEDKITDHIPGSSEPYVPNITDYNIPNKSSITIRLLLEHRAGVYDVDNNIIPTTESVPYAGQNYILYVLRSDPTHTFNLDELITVLGATQLYDFAPGVQFKYSDTGYTILGKIIERVSGKSFRQFVHDNLAVPNGLTETTFPDFGTEQTIPAPYETGYTYQGGHLYEVTNDNASPHVAEGNVITTPRDLATWIKRLISSQAGLNSDTVRMMTTVLPTGAALDNYGLGITYVPGLGYGHGGSQSGYLTVMNYDPTQEVAVVIQASGYNSDDTMSEINCLYDIGREAKNILGYSTAQEK